MPVHRTRMAVRTIHPIILMLVLLSSCSNGNYIFIEGFAQGSTYHVTCSAPAFRQREIRTLIDSRLDAIDNSLSGYNKGSLLSRINAGEDLPLDRMFIDCFEISRKVWEESGGMFDPSAAPLFDLWGFGFQNKGAVTQEAVDSILQFVGMDLLSLEERGDGTHLVKADSRMKVNFNAVAQGYSCDVVAALLDSLGCKDYLIDIGREICCRGVNPKGTGWRIGLDRPTDGNMEEGQDLQTIIEVTDCGIVTSGNYRKFYIENGEKLAHTIDPSTGRPVTHNLLCATVIAENASTADAYATWLMVAGPDRARSILESRGLEGMLVYGLQDSMAVYRTNNIKTIEQ